MATSERAVSRSMSPTTATSMGALAMSFRSHVWAASRRERAYLIGRQRMQARGVPRIEGGRHRLFQHAPRLSLPRRDRLDLFLLPLPEGGSLDDGIGEQQVRELEPSLEVLRDCRTP